MRTTSGSIPVSNRNASAAWCTHIPYDVAGTDNRYILALYGNSLVLKNLLNAVTVAIKPACAFESCHNAINAVRKYTRGDEDIELVIDVRAVFQQAHRTLALEAMPALLLPRKGSYGLRDYEKMFCSDIKGGSDIFAMRGIDRQTGCMVVVRPDQYVGQILPLDGYEALTTYFAGFMLPLE
jgi:phenol 2-monooxygenase